MLLTTDCYMPEGKVVIIIVKRNQSIILCPTIILLVYYLISMIKKAHCTILIYGRREERNFEPKLR